MTRPLNRRLLEEQKRHRGAIVRQMVGTVVNDSPFTVRVRGVDRENLVYLGGYAPAFGDRVLLTQRGNEPPVVHGKLGTTAAPSPSWNNVGSIEFFGHSGVYGGATNPQRGTDQRLGALLGADTFNRSRGGSRLCWHESALQMIGGWAHIYRHIAPPEATGSINPQTFISNRDVVVLFYGENDLPTLGPSADDLLPLTNSLEATISRARASHVYEETSTSVTYPSGSWTTVGSDYAGYVSGGGNLLFASGGGYKQAASGSFSIAVPNNFPGGNVALSFISGAAGEGANVTFTVDGQPSGAISTIDMNAHDYGTPNDTGTHRNVSPVVKRFTGLGAGPHTIVGTVGSGVACMFDCWWIEALSPPVVVVVGGWNTSNAQPNFNFYSLAGFPYVPNAISLDGMNMLMSQVCTGFDDDVIFVDPDPLWNRDPVNFANDHLHPSDNAHSLLAAEIALRIQSRARTRLAHAQGSGSSAFISANPVAGRNIIEAQQADAAALVLKGRKAGDQLVPLLSLDGSGSWPILALSRLAPLTDARIGIATAAGILIAGTAAGDLAIRSDQGKVVVSANSTTRTVIDTAEARVEDDTHAAKIGIYGVPYLNFDADVQLYRSAADEMTLAGGDHMKTDDPTSAQHVATKAYVDRSVGAYTRWAPDQRGSHATNTAATANSAYVAELYCGPSLVTGVEFRPTNTTGNVKAILYNSAGAILAKTTATVAVAGNAFGLKQQVAFSGAVGITTAGVYYIGLAFSAAATYTSISITKRGAVVASSYTTPVDPITPPTDIGASFPYMHLY